MSEKINIQWGYDLVKNAYLNKSKFFKKKDSLYLYNLLPFSREIYGEKNPLLLFGGHDVLTTPKCKTVIARDGLIPLSIFFQNVEPEIFHPELYIHRDFWFLVPREWRKKIKYFDLEAKTIFSSENLPEEILITGMLNSSFADPEDFEHELTAIATLFSVQQLENIKAGAYFATKGIDLWEGWDDENMLACSRFLFQKIKKDIDTPSLNALMSRGNYENCLYMEINKGFFVKDSFLEHFILSRGGGKLKQVFSDKEAYFKKIGSTDCSFYHRYNYYEVDENIYESSSVFSSEWAYYKKASEAASKKKVMNFDWEKWYSTYTKRFYKNELKHFPRTKRDGQN